MSSGAPGTGVTPWPPRPARAGWPGSRARASPRPAGTSQPATPRSRCRSRRRLRARWAAPVGTWTAPLGSALSAAGYIGAPSWLQGQEDARARRGSAARPELHAAAPVIRSRRDAPGAPPLQGRTQARVAACGQHLDHAAAQLQQRHVPGAAAQVEHEHRLVLLGRHAVRERGRDGLPAMRARAREALASAERLRARASSRGAAPVGLPRLARTRSGAQACQLGSRTA